VTISVNPDWNGASEAILYEPGNFQQNIKAGCRFTKATENDLVPLPYGQRSFKIKYNAFRRGFFCQFQVETTNALFEIAKTEPTTVRTPIGYVQVKIVIKPIDSSGFFFPNHPFLQVLWNGIQAFIYLTFFSSREKTV
jgi:hypothetical protein